MERKMMKAAPLSEDVLRAHNWRNALHTWILILGSALLMGAIAWTVFGFSGLVWAAIFGAFALWSASRVSPMMILKLFKARPLGEEEAPQLHRLMRELTQRADLPTVPRLHYVPSKLLNAFAVGRPEDSAIAVTDGLLRAMDMRQIAGILAHEVSHIRSGDLRVMALADVLARLTGTMSMFGLIGIPILLGTRVETPWIGVALLIAAPTLSGLLQLGLSRAREYDADLDGATLTGDPEGLASALALLEKKQGRLWESIVLPGGRTPQPSLLRTHPATQDRIDRLMALRPGAKQIAVAREPVATSGSIVPVVRPPRIHWARMGVWY
jgi:heat shock protein HtpX